MDLPPISYWGVQARLQPLTGGHRHRVFRTLGREPELVFKTTDRSEAALAWLHPVLDAARTCGLVVPKMVATQAGTWLADGWTCETFVRGAPATSQDRVQLVEPIAAFHAKTAHLSQRPGFADVDALQRATTGGDVDLSAMPSALVAACRAAWRDGVAGPLSVVHGDLSLGNIIRCADGQIAVIDWDECRRDATVFDTAVLEPATPAQNRARLAWEVACCWTREPDRARDLANELMRDVAR